PQVLLDVTVQFPPVILSIFAIEEPENQQPSDPPPGSCSVTTRPEKPGDDGDSVCVHLPIVGVPSDVAHSWKLVVSPVGLVHVFAGREVCSVWSPQCGPGTSAAVPLKVVLPTPTPYPCDWQNGSTEATPVSSLEK